jgi:hypothetical protein
MSRCCAGLIAVLAVGATAPLTSATALSADSADSAAVSVSDCPAAPEGLVINRWTGRAATGDIGYWNNDKNWSLKKYPRRNSKQVVCIRTSGQVVLPVGADLQVHVAAIDIAAGTQGPADVVVRRSDGLYVDEAPTLVKSQLASGSRLRVKGGALGGSGLILARGEVVLDAQTGWTNVLTTRQCGAVPLPGSCTTAPSTASRVGTLQVTGGGLLRINRGLTRVTDGYDIVVAGGQLLMTGDGGRVTADGGTSLTLHSARRVPGKDPKPVLVFQNDGGWYTGENPFALAETRVSLNGTIVRKEGESTGTSTIEGSVTTKDVVRADIQTGVLAVADARLKVKALLTPATTYSTGSCSTTGLALYGCLPTATPTDTVIASVKLPGSADDAQVSITETSAGAGATGTATKVEETGLDVTRSDPAVLRLRYDASVIGARTPASTVVEVYRKGSFRILVDCTSSGHVPDKSHECVDRRAGHSLIDDSDGDLVMEVHTLHFSRWIIS